MLYCILTRLLTSSPLLAVAGSQLEGPQCPRSGEGGIDNCFAAYLHLHITKHASAYLEVRLFPQSDGACLVAANTTISFQPRQPGYGSPTTISTAMVYPRFRFTLGAAFYQLVCQDLLTWLVFLVVEFFNEQDLQGN